MAVMSAAPCHPDTNNVWLSKAVLERKKRNEEKKKTGSRQYKTYCLKKKKKEFRKKLSFKIYLLWSAPSFNWMFKYLNTKWCCNRHMTFKCQHTISHIHRHIGSVIQHFL